MGGTHSNAKSVDMSTSSAAQLGDLLDLLRGSSHGLQQMALHLPRPAASTHVLSLLQEQHKVQKKIDCLRKVQQLQAQIQQLKQAQQIEQIKQTQQKIGHTHQAQRDFSHQRVLSQQEASDHLPTEEQARQAAEPPAPESNTDTLSCVNTGLSNLSTLPYVAAQSASVMEAQLERAENAEGPRPAVVCTGPTELWMLKKGRASKRKREDDVGADQEPRCPLQGMELDGKWLTKAQVLNIFALRSRKTATDSEMDQTCAGRSPVVGGVFSISAKSVRDVWSRSLGAQFTRPEWTIQEKKQGNA